MSYLTTVRVVCDGCGALSHFEEVSHTKAHARAQANENGWLRAWGEKYDAIHTCPKCRETEAQ